VQKIWSNGDRTLKIKAGRGEPGRRGAVRGHGDHLHAAYAEPLGVTELAKAAGMSRFHFSRLFQDQVGDPRTVTSSACTCGEALSSCARDAAP
jgi:AraC-like DNA-binding protein